MTKTINDYFPKPIQAALDESSGEVDGKFVLGKMRGEFFFPEGVSRNNRFYSKTLWEKQLNKPEIRERLQSRRMFGTISHSQELDDQAFLEGKFSHIVTNLKIENGKGIGEALILNTPAGRILHTVLGAQSKVYISSRADGEFNGEHQGIPKVDEDSYDLKGFDIVIDPGFLQANPNLVESLEKDLSYCFNEKKDEGSSQQNPTGGKIMPEDKSVMEQLIIEKNQVAEKLESAQEESSSLKADNKMLKERVEELKGQIEKHAETENALKEAKETIKAYEAIGSAEDVDAFKEKLEKASKVVEELESRDLGSPEEIEEALTSAKAALKEYAELGTPKELAKALKESKKTINAYSEMGTPEEIQEALEKTKAYLTKAKDEQKAVDIKAFAQEHGLSEKAVSKVWDVMSKDELVEYFAEITESVKGSDMKSRFKKDDVSEGNKDESKSDSKRSRFMDESVGQRLVRHFS